MEIKGEEKTSGFIFSLAAVKNVRAQILGRDKKKKGRKPPSV